jgi:type II secretory pathway component PulK
MEQRAKNREQGVALIMVIFMIVITSALLVSLTDSTYISMRLNRAAEQRLKAEYILKSAVNVAQVLIKSDTTQYDDPSQDLWMKFVEGAEIPGELVGVTEPNVRVNLLIASEKGKIPLLSVVSASGADRTWRNVLVALFENLGFDTEQRTPGQSDGSEQTKMYSSKEMVANLIDYLDADKDSYSDSDFQAQGIEGDLPPGEEFRNDRAMESLSSELGSIPGFTPNRVQRILPFVSIRIRDSININAAPVEVLRALIVGMDSSAAPEEAERLIACRDPAAGGPYNQNFSSQMAACIDPNVANTIKPKLVAQGDVFSVIAKVEYGLTTFMASANLKAVNGRLPTIENFLLY